MVSALFLLNLEYFNTFKIINLISNHEKLVLPYSLFSCWLIEHM